MDIQLNKKSHKIILDFNALSEYEDLTGENGFQLPKKMTTKIVRALAYVGIKAANPNEYPSIEEVGKGINFEAITAVTEAYIYFLEANSVQNGKGTGKKKEIESLKV